MIALAFIDVDHFILPDEITLPFLWLGLLLNSVISPYAISAQEAIWGAALGYLLPWGIYWLFKRITQKEGLGYGDFKLLALLGAWLGWYSVLLSLFVASVLGSMVGLFLIIVKKRDRRLPLPFGPFLCVGGWVSLVWGNAACFLF